MKTHAVARSTDPDTARKAAAKMSLTNMEDRVFRCLAENGPSNTVEIARRLNTERDSVSPRMKRLVLLGLVEDSSERRDGKIVWRLTRKQPELF